MDNKYTLLGFLITKLASDEVAFYIDLSSQILTYNNQICIISSSFIIGQIHAQFDANPP